MKKSFIVTLISVMSLATGTGRDQSISTCGHSHEDQVAKYTGHLQQQTRRHLYRRVTDP